MKKIIYYLPFFVLIACSSSPKKESTTISDSEGRIVARYKQGKVHTFFYEDKTGKLEKVIAADTKSKNIVTTNFFYKDGNLIRAEKSTGEQMNLQYDSANRIAKVATRDGIDIVDIQYNKNLNKPSLVKYSDGRSHKVFYKSNGSLEKVETTQETP